MQKNHAEIAIVDEPQLDVIFSYRSLRSDFLSKYSKESPFFRNPLFVIFDHKHVSVENLLVLFTHGLSNSRLFYNSATYFRNLFYLNFITFSSRNLSDCFSQKFNAHILLLPATSKRVGRFVPTTLRNATAEVFYPSNIIDKRNGAFLFGNLNLRQPLRNLFQSSKGNLQLSKTSFAESMQNIEYFRDANLQLQDQLFFSTALLKTDWAVFLKQTRWLYTYSPINKSDISSFNYFSSLEKGGLSFKGDQFLFAESFEWQSFRNVLLSQTSIADYTNKTKSFKNINPRKDDFDYQPTRNLVLDYYSAATLDSFKLQEHEPALTKLINPKTLSFNYILTSAIPSKKVFDINLAAAALELDTLDAAPVYSKLRRLL
jgi:hypothetical protein